ncbi:MAG: sugar ABC transporter permease [Clostridiales bacterium]|jgi:multiple sugar transport system permease protein|nr:sugar ABC transporter permease [Clostridiales bacterium]
MKKAKRRALNSTRAPMLVFMAPFVILFTVFTVTPIISSVVLSFTSYNMFEPPEWAGFDNYVRMFFDDDVFLIAIRNTLVFALITGPVGYALSFIFAWLINEFPRGVRSFLTVIFYGPNLAGNVYFIWVYIFSGDSVGFLNSVLYRAGLIAAPVQWLTDPKTAIGVVTVVILWLSMGAGFLAFVAGLQNKDHQVYEAGAIDGIRNRFQELWYITLPQMKPQLLFGAVMTISTSFAVGYEAMNLTGFPSTDYAAHTVVLHIMDVGSIRFELGYASAVAVVLFAVMMAIWTAVNNALREKGE